MVSHEDEVGMTRAGIHKKGALPHNESAPKPGTVDAGDTNRAEDGGGDTARAGINDCGPTCRNSAMDECTPPLYMVDFCLTLSDATARSSWDSSGRARVGIPRGGSNRHDGNCPTYHWLCKGDSNLSAHDNARVPVEDVDKNTRTGMPGGGP